MSTNHYIMPERLVQAIGLACVPVHDIGPDAGTVARRPIAAAVLTLRQRNDGHLDLVAARMSDIRPAEFPLPYLLEQALLPGALTIVTAEDRQLLGIELAQRRYFLEPRLAAVIRGERTVDHARLLSDDQVSEPLICRRLSIPYDDGSAAESERLYNRDTVHLVEERALARAVSRLMLWSTIKAALAAQPGLFFEPMLALHPWLQDQADTAPIVARWATSRPIMRAVSFASQYRASLARRETGEGPGWTEFREGLFHT